VSQVRERILIEATGLFARQGYSGTSVREIVEAAGVTKPTLYYYFGNKEGLFKALVQVQLSTGLDGLQVLLDAPGTVLERLNAMVRVRVQLVEQQPELVRFMAEVMMNGHKAVPQIDCSEYFANETRLLSELFSQGIASGELIDMDPAEMALGFMGLFHFRFAAAISGGPPLTDQTVSMLLQLFASGVAR
jgi:AcrR family transcriptional regulator